MLYLGDLTLVQGFDNMQTHLVVDGKKSITIRGKKNSKSIHDKGIQFCDYCRNSETPQWRKGPLGKNSLCNRCGLRFRKNRLSSETILETIRGRMSVAIVLTTDDIPNIQPSMSTLEQSKLNDDYSFVELREKS